MTIEERLKDIKEHPEKHKHSFEELYACAVVDGVLVLQIIDAHQADGSKCDVHSGPCSCGGWH